MADPMRCDFCSTMTLPPVRMYRAEAFTHVVIVNGQPVIAQPDPDWWACAPCAALVGKNRREALANRSLWSNPTYPELVLRGDDDGISLLYALIEGFHARFFENRIPDIRLV